MGKRSRKRRPDGPTAAPTTPTPASTPAPSDGDGGDALKRGYARSEERNERIRQSLEPLAPGERPGAVTVAAILAAVLALANLGLALAGFEVRGEEQPLGGVAIFSALMFAAAAGMWRAKYWAVLGFQALLALTVMIAGLSLTVASNALAVLGSLAIVLLGGWLFWKLVRALARLQMPAR